MNDVNWVPYILTGGWLKGYRTYVLGGVALVAAIANYVVGDGDLVTTINAIALAFGLFTARNA